MSVSIWLKEYVRPKYLGACLPFPNLRSSYVFLKLNKFIFKVSDYVGFFSHILEGGTWVAKGSSNENTKLTTKCCMLAFSEHFLLTQLSSPERI